MKIRRFNAETMSAAMAQVRNELGSDAVILSNNSRGGQVEIVCAVPDHLRRGTRPTILEKFFVVWR